MAKNKKKTGNTPQNKSADRDRRKQGDAENAGSPKSGAGSLSQKSDRDVEDRLNDDADIGSPKGSGSGVDPPRSRPPT